MLNIHNIIEKYFCLTNETSSVSRYNEQTNDVDKHFTQDRNKQCVQRKKLEDIVGKLRVVEHGNLFKTFSLTSYFLIDSLFRLPDKYIDEQMNK